MSGGPLGEALIGSSPTVFTLNGGLKVVDTPVYARERLPIAQELSGPAIIIQLDSTTVVPPTSTVNRDRSGNLLISVNHSAAKEK